MNKNNIIKNYKLKFFFFKNEYKYFLYKSMIQSNYFEKITKQLLRYRLSTWKTKYRISSQKRVCIILGRNRSVHPKLNLKRHTIKKMNASCFITGLSMGKW